MKALEINKTYLVGDFILRVSEKGILRVTTDKGKAVVLPRADNVIEVKSIKYKSL